MLIITLELYSISYEHGQKMHRGVILCIVLLSRHKGILEFYPNSVEICKTINKNKKYTAIPDIQLFTLQLSFD